MDGEKKPIKFLSFSNFSHFKLSRTFLNSIFVIALLSLVTLSFISYQQVNKLVKSNALVIHTYQVIQRIDSLLSGVIEIESESRGHLITGDDSFLSNADLRKDALKEDLDALINLTKENIGQTKRIVQFKELLEQRLTLLNHTVKLKMSNQLHDEIGKNAMNNSVSLSKQIKGLGQEIKSIECVLLSERNARVLQGASITSLILIVGSVFGFLFLGITFLLTNAELSSREQAELATNTSKTRLGKIIESVSDMIAAFDQNRRFIIFNEAYRKEFKLLFNKNITVGMTLDEALAEILSERQEWASIWKESLEWDDYSRNIELEINNEHNFYEVTANFIENNELQIIGSVQSIRNITKRVEEHTKLQKSYEEQALSMKELQKKNDQVTLLVEMSDIMLACSSQAEINAVMNKYPQRLLHFASGYLYVMHPSKNYLEMTASWGNPTLQEKLFNPDQCWAIKLGRRHQVNNAQDELVCGHIKAFEKENTSFVCVPLMAQNDVYGLLYLETTNDSQYFVNENEKLLVNAFSELAALALANVRLRDNLRYQSIRDPLTGLYNRRYLEDFLFKQIHQSERNKATFSVLMLDLDHFKKINDTYGHDAGDAALKEVGKILQHDIREGDIATRYGGEEFIIMYYNIDLQSSITRADKIREDVTKIQIKYGAQPIGPLSISIGIAFYPADGSTPTELIEASDKALYCAKNTGRNKVVVYADINNEGEPITS